MVCEICSSQSFKKENGVFVCQECGTEYTIEDAKKLLKDIDIVEKKEDELLPSKKQQEEANDVTRIKLEYDLLCWHNFFEKCHELEKSFYLKDRDFGSSVDVATREVIFNKDSYYTENVLPEFKNRYIEGHPKIKSDFESDLKKRKANNAVHDAEWREISNSLSRGPKIFTTITVICIFLGIILFIVGLANHVTGLFVFGIILPFAVFGLTMIINYALSKRQPATPCMPIYSFEEYFEKEITKTSDYIAAERKFRQKYNEKTNEDINGFISEIPQLKNIKNHLEEIAPLPQQYSDEYHVNALLALVLNKRADTLKEAINLFETEAYRSTVVSCLDTLNYNIQVLNSNIVGLRNEVNQLASVMYQGLSTLIQQNNAIYNQLDSIRFDTRYLMIDNLLS